ncbi:MAG: class I SAM-dependent RNA methyltransferase [Paracoccaceae bacterium]|nr:class I SAM-dependent RNA methyltransferase [Paracoccaceae bacterium]
MTRRLVTDRLGHRGDGIGGDPAVYVRRALPGEEVEGEVVDGRMRQPRILTPSPDRVRPGCPHYKSCGGCDLMHASDGFVAAWKVEVVRTALAAQGLLAPIRRVHTSPPRSRRRAVLAATRTKTGAVVGIHARGSDRIVAVPDCQVLVDEIRQALPAFEAFGRLGAPRKAEIRIAVTFGTAGLDVAVSDAKAPNSEGLAEIVAVAGAAGLARLTWNADPVFQAAAPAVKLGDADVVPPPGAFLQATEAGERALVAGVAEALGGCAAVVNLFAGAGTFGLALAAAARVHAVEADRDLLSALDGGWRRAGGLKAVTTEARDLFRRPLLADELARFDGAVIDPPRAGAEAQSAILADAGPSRLAAVSCNPATFARDAATLARGGYNLDWIDVVDQFRWSPHVELVASLTRAKK